MKPGTRMMMMEKMRESRSRSEYGNDRNRRMIGYDRTNTPERGYTPMNPPIPENNYPQSNMPMPERAYRSYAAPAPESGYPPMNMAPMDRGYPSMGMPRSERGYKPTGMAAPEWDYMPPMEAYDNQERRSYGGPEMRRRRDRRGRYMMADGEPEDEEEDDKYHLRKSKMATGGSWSSETKPEKVDERKAMEWTRKMRNPDGTVGPHYNAEVAEQLRASHCPKCGQWEFMVALNMMYADYCEVAKKFAADKPEFYACMAKAFLEDPDAGKGKLSKYMETIPE